MSDPRAVIRGLRDAVENRIDVDELLRDVLHEWGGTAGLARSLKDVYDASNDGSQTRARILSDVMSLIHRRTDSEAGEEDSEEDLEALGKQLLGAGDGDAD